MSETAEGFEAVILEDKPEAGITIINGREYMIDAREGFVPADLVKAEDKIEDEIVRKIIAFAQPLSDQVARFWDHTMADLNGLDALLEQEYGLKKGGKKGNRTYLSFDGLMKVQVSVSDHVVFGPQLQVAKKILDGLMMEWSSDSRPEIRAIITKAFNTDKEGQVSRSDIFALLRLSIEDEQWKEAMRAIRAAMRVIGSKEYVRFYRRATVKDDFTAITIDLAKAGA